MLMWSLDRANFQFFPCIYCTVNSQGRLSNLEVGGASKNEKSFSFTRSFRLPCAWCRIAQYQERHVMIPQGTCRTVNTSW